MANLNIPIEQKTRWCTVNGELGRFHIWEHYSKPLEASPMIDGAPAGVFSKVFGIVEFADGIRKVEPTDICFCDETNHYLVGLKRHMDESKLRRD